MLFFFVGIAVGSVILVYGTKKGWLSGKVDALEEPKREEDDRNIKEIVDEDKESINPNKDLFEKFQERVVNDPDFKGQMNTTFEQRKEKLFKGLSSDERTKLEEYFKEEAEKTRKREQKNLRDQDDAFRSFSFEIFIFVALIVFIWWGLSQHMDLLSPAAIANRIVEVVQQLVELPNKNETGDL